MMSQVTFVPEEKTAHVLCGLTLLEAGEKAGIDLEAGCMSCTCGTCVVEVLSGMDHLEAPAAEELDVLDQWNKDPDRFRLACCTRVRGGDVRVRHGHGC